MVASSFVVPGGVCITVVCVVFSAFSPSTSFGGMVVHFAVCAYVLVASVSSSTSASATLPAIAAATATTMISATGV